jgi:hypothetical protein
MVPVGAVDAAAACRIATDAGAPDWPVRAIAATPEPHTGGVWPDKQSAGQVDFGGGGGEFADSGELR